MCIVLIIVYHMPSCDDILCLCSAVASKFRTERVMMVSFILCGITVMLKINVVREIVISRHN